MKTKTFKIGECAKGGIITVEVRNTKVSVIGKEWDFSTGSRRSSDQSNAKEFTRLTVEASEFGADRKLSEFLNDLTTSYYTDQIMKWIENAVQLRLFW